MQYLVVWKFQAPLLFLLCLSLAGASSQNSLTEQVTRIQKESRGVLGVVIRRAGAGNTFEFRGRDRFPLASTFKLPLAAAILDRVDRGELRLDQPVEVKLQDVRTWASPIAKAHPQGGVSLPLQALLKAILLDSDNTATDALLRGVESPKALTAWLQAKGFGGIRVDRNEGEAALDAVGVTQHPAMSTWTPAIFKEIFDKAPQQQQTAALKAFAEDPRDTTTPEQMALLLEKLQRGTLLSPKSTQLLLQWMTATEIGAKRIRGLLPPGTLVAHRTGTMSDEHFGAATNDVGIIALPQGRGRLVIAVYLKSSTASRDDRELAIAKVAKAAWNVFGK